MGDEASFLSDLLRKRRGSSVISGKTELSSKTEVSDTSSMTHNANASSLTYSNGRSYHRGQRGGGGVHDGEDTIIRVMRRYYNEGGEMLPKTRKEWVAPFALAILLSPLVHVAVLYLMAFFGIGNASNGGSSSYYGGEIQYLNGPQLDIRKGGSGGPMVPGQQQDPNYAKQQLLSKAWAGSSQVMLSKFSSLRENVILIPDTDWVELQISRSRAKQDSSGLFQKKKEVAPKPPKRLPLPSKIDPQFESYGMVLYSLTAANFDGRSPAPQNKELTPNISRMNGKANADLWDALQKRLTSPRPVDAWPCWNHNSLAKFREDGYVVMYPLGQRNEARRQIVKLAREFGQEVIYEFVTLSETPSDGAGGGVGGTGAQGGSLRGGPETRAGSVRRIGKDGSALVIPALPDGRSDVMIRRTISTSASTENGDGEPTVVMRRVKDLPVEDELTMRGWEGPPLHQIVWEKERVV